MSLCCNLPIECNKFRTCVQENADGRITLLKSKENLLLGISTSNKQHDIPTAEMEKLKEIVNFLKYKVLNMYHLGNICFAIDDETKENHLKFFNEFENHIDYFLKRAEQRCVTLGRKSVGFCGQFSSGKSALINHLFGFIDNRHKLPEDVMPTTAIPTYAIYSKFSKLVFENFRRNVFVTDEIATLSNIRHHSQPCGFPWASIIERLYYFSDQLNPSVVCVDLPGFNKDTSLFGQQTDYKASLRSATSCDAITYLIHNRQGSLSNQDIDFLKKLNHYSIPLLVVISFVDLIHKSQAYTILNKIKTDLEKNEIEYENIILHSSRPEEIEDDEAYKEQISKNQQLIKEFINKQKDVDDDMDYIRSFIKVMFDRLEEADKNLREQTANMASMLSEFTGENKLSETFFKRWKSIEEQVYNSDTKYLKINEGFFTTTKEFDINGFRETLLSIANNFRKNEASNFFSPMNFPFIELSNVSILQYIDNVAMTVDHNKSTVDSDSIKNEREYIDNIQENYNTVVDMIEGVKTLSMIIPTFILQEINTVEEDIANTFNQLKDNYNSLISKARENFEKLGI